MAHKLYKIIKFELKGAYKIQITFDDHSIRLIDFEPILLGPVYGPLQDTQLFNQVSIDPVAQTLSWPNGADFDPETLRNWEQYSSHLVSRLKKLAFAGA